MRWEGKFAFKWKNEPKNCVKSAFVIKISIHSINFTLLITYTLFLSCPQDSQWMSGIQSGIYCLEAIRIGH